jgi:hypothetical protein
VASVAVTVSFVVCPSFLMVRGDAAISNVGSMAAIGLHAAANNGTTHQLCIFMNGSLWMRTRFARTQPD